MAEEANKGQADDQGANTETDSGKSTESTFDTSKLTDQDFEKIFADQRLYQHSRFKSLSEKAKEADALKKAQEESEAKTLKEQEKWKELAEKHEKTAQENEQKYKQTLMNSAIQAEAAKAGVTDLDAAVKLIDASKITIDENGVSGVEDAVKALVERKPYLKGTNNPTVGSGSNPGNGNEGSAKSFKLSQIQDAKFYQQNRDDILKAQKLGLVENDIAQA